LAQGPAAARAGAHAMIDLSDGLVRDLRRVCQASGTGAELDRSLLAEFVAPLARVLGQEVGWRCVLAGGEEHSLLACFAPQDRPPGWHPVGRVTEAGADGPGVRLEGEELGPGGWDHFGG
ncbi:AIR synthase-related protein, partial [Ornithinicoccus halotolerans]|uniref:AIR synthase-related protein n=1 Tax=Ornithinicoccus halotolerans TaxID=1748220 RepID=UPI00225E6568